MKTTFLLLAVWAMPFLLDAQVELERVEHYSYEEGLNDQVIRNIRRDKEGFIWVATNRDVNRFDGYQFLPFDNLPNHRFRVNGSPPEKIEPLGNGTLFIQYRKNLAFFDLLDPDSLTCRKIMLDASTGLEGQPKALFAAPNGTVFVLSTAGALGFVWRLKERGTFEKVLSFPLSVAAAEQEVFRFFKSRKGIFWVHSSLQGVFQVDASGVVLSRTPAGELGGADQGGAPAAIFREDRRGNIWLALKNRPGVYRFDEGSRKFQLSRELPAGEAFSDLWEDALGNLLFATRRDFATVAKLYSLAAFRPAGSPADTTAFSSLLGVEDKLMEVSGDDFFRDVFLGTYTGMYHVRFKNRQVRHYLDHPLKTGEFGMIIRGITGDGDGNVWIALEVDYWYHFNVHTYQLDTFRLVDEATGKAFDQKGAGPLYYDPAGYVWGKSHTLDHKVGLLHRYSTATQTVKTYRFPDLIQSFCQGPDRQIWLTCSDAKERGKLIRFDPATEQWSVYKNADGANPLLERDGYFMASWKNGEVWIATNKQLVFVNTGEGNSRVFGQSEDPAKQCSAEDLLTICKGPDNTVLMGTVGGGINILDPATGNIQVFDKTNGLSNNDVCGIVPDRQGNYWVSTFYGLNYFNRLGGTFGSFYASDGLTHNEFNRFAYYGDPSGLFFFGGVNGLNVFRAEDLIEDQASLQVNFTCISKYFGAAGRLEERSAGVNNLEKLIIEPGVSYFQLDFMLPEYMQAEQNQFSYRMVGQDKEWVYLGKNHTLRFNRLPPGHYTLQLNAAGAKGIWTTKVRTLEIEVQEVFYRQTWFTFLMIGTLVGGVIVVARRRERAIRKREERRTRINQKFAELELKALQAQMNPHFIFNALGAIQFIVQEGRIREADDFLAKFAQLMRMFLESSKNKFIALSEEIRMLKLYVELEQLRFEGRFEAAFEVEDDLEPEDIEIPSMLIQPFVENAINHGLFHRKDKGRLDILFSQIQTDLVCIVEDNGVGRKTAARLQANSLRSHKSRAMQIVQERLEGLTHMDGFQVQIDIEDLENDSETNQGTRVTIRIPASE